MIKVIPNDGQTNISDLTKAIKWCENNKINIISISLSTTNDDNNMHKEIKKATNMGIHIFAAVANDSFFTSYPAAYKEVIGVYSWKKKRILMKRNIVMYRLISITQVRFFKEILVLQLVQQQFHLVF